MQPVVLPANQPRNRFYAGGTQITALRDGPAAAAVEHTPEDWVASVVPLFGEDEVGLTRLPSGELLRDAVAADPVGWLGPEHVESFGADPHLLVKLLDAGQRLPVHAHPDRGWAARHLGLDHGKTEAWVFLEPAVVHLGFSRDVSADELARWVAEQDVSALLSTTHRLQARAGDAVLVPAGLPHAIGEGALLVELQEPSDLSVLVEWDGFAIDGAAAGHLGLGFETALTAVDRRGLARDAVEGLVQSDATALGPLLPGAGAFFRADRVRGGGGGAHGWEAGFAVVVAVAGAGQLATATGAEVRLERGSTVLVPHAAGPVTVEGDVELVVCRPPSPARQHHVE
ncbi:carbohydrate kinase [Quadrisphaera setariae]|uniref:Carbohydrate kinase n=1 Tax=Quadrisphaera setariae TaxID=2593304 RepID=A0A5C8ZCT9_9ACTN|nr:carbohydrate kinase [Quadrisphaera setariae]